MGNKTFLKPCMHLHYPLRNLFRNTAFFICAPMFSNELLPVTKVLGFRPFSIQKSLFVLFCVAYSKVVKPTNITLIFKETNLSAAIGSFIIREVSMVLRLKC